MRSNVTFGIIVLALCGFLPVFAMEECTSSTSTIRVQTSCKTEDEELTHAHANDDNLQICSKMAEMFKCAVASLPRCYDYFEASTFKMYFHSPFSCDLSEQQIIELQNIIIRGLETGATTAPSSPAIGRGHLTSGSASTYPSEEVTNPTGKPSFTATHSWLQNETVTGHGAGQLTYNKNGHGRNEEQRGSLSNTGADTVTASKLSFLLLLVWSMTLPWRLTS